MSAGFHLLEPPLFSKLRTKVFTKTMATPHNLPFQSRQKTQQQSLRPLDYSTVSIARVAAQTVVKPGSGKNPDRTSPQSHPHRQQPPIALQDNLHHAQTQQQQNSR